VPKCRNCGELILDTHANQQIDDAYRRQLGLLGPEEIRCKREELQLSIPELARRLRVAEDKLTRLESGGQIKATSLDQLLRLTFEQVSAAAMKNGDASEQSQNGESAELRQVLRRLGDLSPEKRKKAVHILALVLDVSSDA